MQEPIQLTDNAVAKIQSLLASQTEANLKLRIYIVGGGCSGFQYGFGFDDKINEDDNVITKGPVAVVVDAMSIQYMMGAIVDYETTLQSSGFKVKNPNAETTCGCGSSFSLKEESL